jgi:uncharacterized glyoxalase superfamily protein PhnB
MNSKFVSYDPDKGFPRVMPSLRYENVEIALAWLNQAFGFVEHIRWTDDNGVILHAEMHVDGAFIELSAVADDYKTPKQLGAASGTIVMFVDDVDGHYERALAVGATVLAEPEDKPWGLRQYRVEDMGGHRWEFSQFLRDVPYEAWGAQRAT